LAVIRIGFGGGGRGAIKPFTVASVWYTSSLGVRVRASLHVCASPGRPYYTLLSV